LRILQINASYKPAFIYGGPTMSVSMLAEQLVKAGVSVMVLTTTANGEDELPVQMNKPVLIDGVNTIYFKRLTKDHTHFSPALLRKVWKEVKNYDVVHIHAWWNLVSVLSCLIAVRRKVPVVLSPRGTLSNYSFHNKNNKIKDLIHRYLGEPLLKRSFIHTTSKNELLAIKSIVQPKGLFNIPNFIKLAAVKPPIPHSQTDHLKLLFFSRIEEKKGLDILLDALKTVTTPWYLTIAGSGDEAYINELKELATENNIADKINWAGFFNEDKFQLLQQHDVMILPSHDENFGNVVIESLSVGTPVLITENVGLADYVKKNNLGWVCEKNASSVSERINLIGNQKEVLEEIRDRAPGKILADFEETKLVRKYIDMYNQIIHS
jgi:glycosyltransferase involved in cell wall biosynthesis